MIHLDTHVMVWLYERRRNKLSRAAVRALEREPAKISAVVLLELEILNERGRLSAGPDSVLRRLDDAFGLSISQAPLPGVIKAARGFAWTRDPFDRLIVANAMADGARLVTADELIRRHFPDAVW